VPTIDEIQDQVHDLQTKAIELVKTYQAPAVDYVGKAAETVAERLPADKPELLVKGLDALTTQAAFVKDLLDTEVAFAKAVIDAAVTPFAPPTPTAATAPTAA
jgi:hypothetical protein